MALSLINIYGTGVVHIAPAFGEDDYQVGRKYNLPVLQPVGEDGKYTETPWKGRFVMEDGLDIEIITWLKENGKLFKKEKVLHNYPHCWRCKTPLLYYAKPSWYIEMTKIKDRLIENNNGVDWYPDVYKRQDLDTEVTAVVLGSKIDAMGKELARHGADRVIMVDDPALEVYTTEPYVHAFTEIINKYKPEVVLFGATAIGRDMAPVSYTHLDVYKRQVYYRQLRDRVLPVSLL